MNPSETLAEQAEAITDSYLGISAQVGEGGTSLLLTSDNPGINGDFIVDTSDLTDPAPAGAALSYTPSSAYSIGVSNDAVDSVYDSFTGQTSGAPATFTADSSVLQGIASISYSDAAGQNLSATSLTNQDNAKSALTAIGAAIADVAAQDGYIGAQINTLNAVAQVLNTQQENLQSAQNAVQATDYAMASSNMAKYEILSQTGIAALAQASTVQQEITKLLQ